VIIRKNISITLERNPNSWHTFASNAPERVIIQLYRNPVLAFNDFVKKKLDMIELGPALAEFWEKERKKYIYNIREERIARPILWFFYYNCAREPLNDLDFRRVLSCAVREENMKAVIPLNGRLATRWTPWESLGYQPQPPAERCHSSIDTEVLKKLKKPLELIAFNTSSSIKRAEMVKKELKRFDIEVKIEAMPFSGLIQRLVNQQYDLIDIYWGPFYGSLENYYSTFVSFTFPPKGNNFGKCSSPEGDRFYEAAVLTGDPNEALSLYRKFELELNNAPPGILSHFTDAFILLGDKIKTASLHPFGYREYEKFVLK
jgi:ABC-type oligopeptide transport system substrate-binding subunit